MNLCIIYEYIIEMDNLPMRIHYSISLGLLLGITLLGTLSVSAHDDQQAIDSPDELSRWCKTLVEQHYLAQNLQPRNWREAPVVDGEYYKTNLVFRIDYEDYTAECTVHSGAQRKYVVLKLLGKR
ncbi:MAG: hypothetical protein HY080_14710 [Gammaproteobacteria bacterium]|nr:hypothetical protein [Gammaproteobacteria bacterium]